MEFASKEYLKEVMERSNVDEKYLELAKGEDASYTFMIQAEPKKGVEKDIVLGYTVEDGKTTDIWLGERKTDFAISGKYSVWVNILTGKMGVTRAFLMRKLKVRGNLMKILKMSKATERWLEVLRTIPTEFHGEYSKYNIKE
ncbi:MAG: SCP2 sterol-binding domain-containing protein [Candidatus Bathyarchaeota archaeon]|nr:SCP2 sterol-binding domain-containing protein [Candidatus Bathyarchaeota archaeon]